MFLNADGRSTETGLYHDRYLLPAGRSAANRSGRMMEQTDGRTAIAETHAPLTLRAVPIS